MPGPAIGFLQIVLQWLDHWLKGRDTGMPGEPTLLSWLPQGFTIASTPAERPGRWVQERAWPSPAIAEKSWWLGHDRLLQRAVHAESMSLHSSLLSGAGAGEFMPLFATGDSPELPRDQREDDAQSCVFDSEPLPSAIAILGTPVVRLALDSRAVEGQVVVRICEVAPDGSSRRVSWGARNLALSDDLLGDRLNAAFVTIPLYATADSFAAGNRVRLAVSTSYWPILWPAAVSTPLRLHLDECQLSLPVRHPRDDDPVGLPSPESGPPPPTSVIRPGRYERKESVDPVSGVHVIEITDDMGELRLDDIALSFHEATNRVFRIHPENPASAAVETRISCGFRRDQWSAETVVLGRVSRPNEAISAQHAIRAREGETVVYERDWDECITPLPRRSAN